MPAASRTSSPPPAPPRPAAWLAVYLALVAGAWFGTTPARAQTPATTTALIPDFRLVDQNPNSPRATNTVSPRDYRLQISAFYFGSAG